MKQGFIQALGVAVYCVLVGLFLSNANRVFGPMTGFLGPATAVMLFSVSALICGLIVFYKPYKLFFENKKREAITIVVSTATFSFGFLLLFLALLLVFR